jgi:hypothetical protein
MKILKRIGILMILFGLPAGSWYFLKDGFNWRKAKLEELAPKGRFLDSYDFTSEDKAKIFEQTTYKTTLVKLNEDLSKNDIALIDQFKKSRTFLFLVLSDHLITHEDFSSKQPLRYINASNINTNNNQFRNANYMLIDTGGVVRQLYKGTDKETLTKIVEDIAVVLPRKITPDIEMKKPQKQ